MPTSRRTHRASPPQRLWAVALLAVTCLAWSSRASAQAAADDMARRHFESGTAYLEQADYEGALREFKKAYDLSGRAEMLINVATAEERVGDVGASVATLSRYLELEPHGEHAESVRLRLDSLRERLEATPESEPEPEPAPPAAAAEPEAVASTPTDAPAADSASSNLPAWILFGLAGASAVGAGVTGALALGEHSSAEDSCSPTCTDDDLATGRAMAMTSTVLTGVAVVAAGVGVVLILSSSGSSAEGESVALTLRGGPGAAMATATLGF